MKKVRLLMGGILLGFSVCAQTTLYDINTIQKIEITFTQPDWDYQLDTAKSGSDGYILAAGLKINGVAYDSVGVKYKGNSSYNAAYKKNPLHIELDAFKNQAYQGIKDIKLGNSYGDPSLIREVLSYDMLKNYMDCPRSNFAQVFINGNYLGLYANDESITKGFCSEHFSSSKGTFFKCNPIKKPSPATKSNLKYITADSSAYFNFYEIKSTTGWNELVALCDTVTNYPASIASIVDIDRVIWMLAFNNAFVNLDSYNGAFAQNYYLYKDNTKRFNPIVWDLNMSFGGFPYAGNSNSSLSGLTVTEMQKLPVTSHATDVYWPLIKNILSNATYKRMYIAHMRTILNEMFNSDYYKTKAAALAGLIDAAVVADTNKFFTDAQFQSAMTTDITSGSYAIPGISNLVTGRISYLQSTADFTNLPPVISAVKPTDTLPALNSTVTIRSTITNTDANAVWLGYRFSILDKFTKIKMLDDGLHQDGAAGDNVYGADISMSGQEMQYYIYAENVNAGMFSPQRAEHEFYKLKSGTATADVGKIVINEFLASNKTGQVNEKGAYEDWIELYNTTASPLNLDGIYLSDSYSSSAKYAFPANTIIQPHGYLVVWADEGTTTPSYIHCNFKLSAIGEQLILSNAKGVVLDSITFGSQVADVSIARCPNGTGVFEASALPSFSASNCAVGIDEKEAAHKISIYPNPGASAITVDFNDAAPQHTIYVFNATGQEVMMLKSMKQSESLDVSTLPIGIYFIRVDENKFRKFGISR